MAVDQSLLGGVAAWRSEKNSSFCPTPRALAFCSMAWPRAMSERESPRCQNRMVSEGDSRPSLLRAQGRSRAPDGGGAAGHRMEVAGASDGGAGTEQK